MVFEGRVERAETHAATFQLVHEPNQLARAPPETVERDQHVTAAKIIDSRASIWRSNTC